MRSEADDRDTEECGEKRVVDCAGVSVLRRVDHLLWPRKRICHPRASKVSTYYARENAERNADCGSSGSIRGHYLLASRLPGSFSCKIVISPSRAFGHIAHCACIWPHCSRCADVPLRIGSRIVTIWHELHAGRPLQGDHIAILYERSPGTPTRSVPGLSARSLLAR